MNSIYTNADPVLLKLFEQAGSLQKVLCAALDFAKKSHCVLLCNGRGDVLKKPFDLPNSPLGAERLIAEVKATCQHRGIALKHVFFGGEDLPSYAENFLARVRADGFLIARVNAFDAKQQRQNLQASSDRLDVKAVAHCLLKGRARVLSGGPDLHHQLRFLVRERDYLVSLLTAVKNRVHPHVDRLFPGFLDPARSGLEAHGPACRWLLGERFSAPQIARRSVAVLAAGLRKCRVREPEEKAARLREYARSVLPPQPELVAVSQSALDGLLESSQTLEEIAAKLLRQIAQLLAQSPAARLTTVPGLGVTLSAGLAAEMFLLREVPPLAQLCSYAGIIPATSQTGGPESAPVHFQTFAHCNLRLKNYLMRAGEAMARQPGSDAAELRKSAELKNQHVPRVLAKHAAGVVRALLLSERAYLPAALYARHSAAEARGAYFSAHWEQLCGKWRPLLGLPVADDN